MQTNQTQTAWVNILSKGVITIPKKIREKVGLKAGDIAEVRVEDNKIIIESQPVISYRTFTAEDVAEWLKDDKLTPKQEKKLAKEIKKLWPDMP